jgi:hypothetical protein
MNHHEDRSDKRQPYYMKGVETNKGSLAYLVATYEYESIRFTEKWRGTHHVCTDGYGPES